LSDLQFASIGDPDLDLVAASQLKRFDDDGGKANREAVVSFGDLHVFLPKT
jgi:hypothetical protein